MTKLAAVLGPSMLQGLGIAAIGKLGESAAQRNVYGKQKRINADWIDFQRGKQEAADVTDAAYRDKSYADLGRAMSGAAAPAREAGIAAEADRLTRAMTGAAVTPEEAIVSGAQFGSSEFRDVVGRKVAEATARARDQIAALAKSSAYGSTTGGMATTRGLALSEGARGIGMTNENRLTDLGTLQRWQSVQPEVLQYQSTGLGDLMMQAGYGTISSGQPLFGGAAGGGAMGSSVVPVPRPVPRPAVAAPVARPLAFGLGGSIYRPDRFGDMTWRNLS